MRSFLVILTALLLASCSNLNQSETLIPANSVVKYKSTEGYQDRFSNIYKKFSDYPVTCEDDCYPETELIECQGDMEDCQYVGPQPQLNLATGFDIHWLGHASFIVNTEDGSKFLFDPVFKQFDWPVNWAHSLTGGLTRKPPTGYTDADIKNVDAVMYSHIHYDHFNKADIELIGNQAQYLVPLGFAKHFENGGYQVSEMAWYAEKQINQVKAHFVPAHHFSGRFFVPFIYEDNDATLWGGWLLEHQGKTLFFAGDTGYSPHFKDIQARYGDIDVCLIPVASYFSEQYPKWYRYVHTTPEDALQAANDLNCKVMIPWGYGNQSWQMGDRSSHSPLFRLLSMEKQMNSVVPLLILNEGDKVKL